MRAEFLAKIISRLGRWPCPFSADLPHQLISQAKVLQSLFFKAVLRFLLKVLFCHFYLRYLAELITTIVSPSSSPRGDRAVLCCYSQCTDGELRYREVK